MTVFAIYTIDALYVVKTITAASNTHRKKNDYRLFHISNWCFLEFVANENAIYSILQMYCVSIIVSYLSCMPAPFRPIPTPLFNCLLVHLSNKHSLVTDCAFRKYIYVNDSRLHWWICIKPKQQLFNRIRNRS